jgi:hypothetical protein
MPVNSDVGRLAIMRPDGRGLRNLAPHLGDSELNLAGFHYFTFNRLLETWRWHEQRRGEA